jgi:DNA-binding NarL/FixJ family response regulator
MTRSRIASLRPVSCEPPGKRSFREHERRTADPRPRRGRPSHHLTRERLQATLDLAKDFLIVGGAEIGEDAVTKVGELTPDIVVMDVRMPGMNGIEAAKAIREASPVTRVIMLVDESRASISDAIHAGVSGYLLKDASAEYLVNAARFVLEGKAVIHPDLMAGASRREAIGLGSEAPEQLSAANTGPLAA